MRDRTERRFYQISCCNKRRKVAVIKSTHPSDLKLLSDKSNKLISVKPYGGSLTERPETLNFNDCLSDLEPGRGSKQKVEQQFLENIVKGRETRQTVFSSRAERETSWKINLLKRKKTRVMKSSVLGQRSEVPGRRTDEKFNIPRAPEKRPGKTDSRRKWRIIDGPKKRK